MNTLLEFMESELAAQRSGDVADAPRLSRQLTVVLDLMSSGKWWTLAELGVAAQASTQSVSARIRDLRKPPLFRTVEMRKTDTPGVNEYRMLDPRSR